VWSVSPFGWVRSARILINNGLRREVGNTGGTHSEGPSFKLRASRLLFRMSFFVGFLRLPLHRHTKHTHKTTCSGMLHRAHWLGFTSPHGVM
jgi:hypothetical protein